jgi:hypothetical protein
VFSATSQDQATIILKCSCGGENTASPANT